MIQKSRVKDLKENSGLICVLLLLLYMAVTGRSQEAQTTTYKYKCVTCGLVETYTVPGPYKCPKDGYVMNPIK